MYIQINHPLSDVNQDIFLYNQRYCTVNYNYLFKLQIMDYLYTTKSLIYDVMKIRGNKCDQRP